MPRGGRHAGGVDTAPNGIQGRLTNSPDYYYFGDCGGDDGGPPPLGCTSMVRVDVWIDNIRIAGSIGDATRWEAQVLRNADGCHVTMGKDRESGATQYTFLWVQFDHTPCGILSEKFVRSLRAMPAVNSFNHRGSGGYGVTLFVCGGNFWHVFMCPLLSHQGSATTIIRN
ncbi:hypothetical protein TcBrA4_0051790 [Trypanosoma cruzi]|nr:hypothetical protein TcBrA4_0051790 [Trypanosoma cruzi]